MSTLMTSDTTPCRVSCASDIPIEPAAKSCADAARTLQVRYDQATRAVQARDDMLAVVAHDLRNPLGVISMATELIQDTGAGDPSILAERLAIIGESASWMERLVQDLLDVSRIGVGELRVQKKLEDPTEVARHAAETLLLLARRSEVKLAFSAEPGLPPIRIDRSRVLQALGNLVSNAVKFTPKGGLVTIHVGRVTQGVRFSVIDTGRGIPASDLPHVFDRFWQADPSDRRGLGLGLAIVKGIVQAHGGTAAAESRLGRGTSMQMTFPLS
jgi:signal transduction histidine kinase